MQLVASCCCTCVLSTRVRSLSIPTLNRVPSVFKGAIEPHPSHQEVIILIIIKPKPASLPPVLWRVRPSMAVNTDNPMNAIGRSSGEHQLPLSSLRLLVPPLRLMSACMWRVAHRRSVLQYGQLAEFVAMVTEAVPELLAPKQTVELMLGLRARLILELLQSEEKVDSEAIQEHLKHIQLLATTKEMQGDLQDGELGLCKMAFVELVQTFTEEKSPGQKEVFFKNVFPQHYGLRFDTTLQILVWEFLSRLEELLPVSSFVEVAYNSDLDSLDPKLEDFGSDAEDLRKLLQHSPKGFPKSERSDRFPFRSAALVLPSSSVSPMAQTAEDGAPRVRAKSVKVIAEEDGCDSEPAIPGQHGEPAVRVKPSTADATEDDAGLTNDDDGDEGSESDGESEGDGPSSSPHSSLAADGSSSRTHCCPHCERSFASWPDLLDHHCLLSAEVESAMATHTSTPTPAASTAPSAVAVARQQGLAFPCDQCPRRLATRAGLQKHLRAHARAVAAAAAGPIVCPQCGKAFKHRSSLKVHLHRHTGARPFLCALCGKTFKEKGVLKTHLRVHSPERPHLCSECGRRFKSLFSYVVHVRVHTGERPFQCDTCGRRFVTSQRLREHRRVHTGERPYGCGECERRFATNALLKRHRLVHTGERPHRCPVCSKGFTQQSNMKIHLRVHRNNNSSNSTSATTPAKKR